jgi:transposase-like protein
LFGAIFAPSATVARRKPYLLWRAVGQHRLEPNILLQKRRDTAAAKQFFNRVLASCHDVPRKIVTTNSALPSVRNCDC